MENIGRAEKIDASETEEVFEEIARKIITVKNRDDTIYVMKRMLALLSLLIDDVRILKNWYGGN